MINALIRAVYRVAHWGLRLLWFIRRPETTGALVAVWHHGRVLLVKNSYRPQLTLPGGYIRPREDRRTAAARELREEVGIQVSPDALRHAGRVVNREHGNEDHLHFFELRFEAEPAVRVDGREIVWAGFHTREEALALDLLDAVRDQLQQR